jgi:hypothetical protein
MKYLPILLFLMAFPLYAQSTLPAQLENQKLAIESAISAEQSKLIVFARVPDRAALVRVVNEQWPDDVETVYNIWKDESGRVVYIGESPVSQSGDWTLDIGYFFNERGQLFAFEKRLGYFREDCGSGIVVQRDITLYDANFKAISTTRTLTDGEGKPVEGDMCGNGYDWVFEVRPTVGEMMELKGIEL